MTTLTATALKAGWPAQAAHGTVSRHAGLCLKSRAEPLPRGLLTLTDVSKHGTNSVIIAASSDLSCRQKKEPVELG